MVARYTTPSALFLTSRLVQATAASWIISTLLHLRGGTRSWICCCAMAPMDGRLMAQTPLSLSSSLPGLTVAGVSRERANDACLLFFSSRPLRFITYRDYADAECPPLLLYLFCFARCTSLNAFSPSRYRDFFRYTRETLGGDRLIMSRCCPSVRVRRISKLRADPSTTSGLSTSASVRGMWCSLAGWGTWMALGRGLPRG
jgi:hypothetical protein